MGDDAISTAIEIAGNLRKINDISVVMETLRRSLKAQLREANRQNSRFSVIIGEKEVQNQTAQVRNMETSEQVVVSFGEIQNYFSQL